MSVRSLAAIRKLSSALRKLPVTKLKSVLVGETYFLGTVDGQTCRDIEGLARKLGLNLVVENTSFTSYLPIDKSNDTAWLIEDDEVAKRIAIEMKNAGVPIEMCEAD